MAPDGTTDERNRREDGTDSHRLKPKYRKETIIQNI